MNRNKNTEESKRVGKAVKAKKRRCYINAMRVIWYIPEYEEADYIEGYSVIDGNFCIEHGWVEQGGVVIDPTLTDDEMVYSPGLRFTGGLGISEALHIPKNDWCEELPISYRFGWGGIESPEFRSAIVAVYSYARMEDIAKRCEEWGSRSVAQTAVD